MLDLTVLGISLQGENSLPILLLHPHGTASILRLPIGPTEAFAISSILDAPESGQANAADPEMFPVRKFPPQGENLLPRSHDLALVLMRALGGRMLALELFRPAEGDFAAEMAIGANSAVLRLNCRPSDGVVLALRCGAPIRAAKAVLAGAEDAAGVISSLPEHLRILVLSRMSSPAGQPEDSRTSGGFPQPRQGLSPNPEPGHRADPGSAPLKGRQSRSVPILPLKAPDQAPSALSGQGKDVKSNLTAIPTKQLGNIRISLVRQNHSGHLEIVEEFCLPAKSAVKDVPPAENLAEAEAILKNGGTEEERWAALLKALSPETKLPM
jgi:bifunctional DNase/RNase